VDESATGPAGFFVSGMTRDELQPRGPDDWRDWLESNHESAAEIWLVFWKKASGKQVLDWAQAVEIALRYGWIDGLIRGIDDQCYGQRFTPRRPKSKWSKVNKELALRLIAAGEMRPMGLRAVEAAKASGEWDRAYTVQRPLPAPDDLKAAIKGNPAAKATRDRLSRTRWDRWIGWLDGSEGRARTRRLNMIVKALETRDFAAVDAAAQRKS
jgi:uncharacterized protein YdeI (YjbR/CyaY-like superfamily)